MPEFDIEELPNEVRAHVVAMSEALAAAVATTGVDMVAYLNASRRSLVAAQVAVVQAGARLSETHGESDVIDLAQVVARRVRDHRIEAGLTQAKLAAEMAFLGFDKWTRVTVAEVENGTRKATLDELLGLATLYSVPMVEFLLPEVSETVQHALLGEVEGHAIRQMVMGPSSGPDWAPAVRLSLSNSRSSDSPASCLWRNRAEMAAHADETVVPGGQA
jgi:transcriptional regulator with XRE-family HTH domain